MERQSCTDKPETMAAGSNRCAARTCASTENLADIRTSSQRKISQQQVILQSNLLLTERRASGEDYAPLESDRFIVDAKLVDPSHVPPFYPPVRRKVPT